MALIVEIPLKQEAFVSLIAGHLQSPEVLIKRFHEIYRSNMSKVTVINKKHAK